MIRTIQQQDLTDFIIFCNNKDLYSDFYITHNNERKFLNNFEIAKQTFNNCFKHNDKAYIYKDNGIIKGIILILGYSDKAERKYIKLLAFDKKISEQLIRYLVWHVDSEVFIKIKKNNPIVNILNQREFTFNTFRNFGFKFAGLRDKEILFKYTLDPNKHTHQIFIKPDDEIKEN